MSLLMESPIAMAAIGLFLVACAAAVYFQTRSQKALGVLLGALLITAVLFVVERAWITPREAVKTSVGELFDAIEANDLAGVLRLIDPQATTMRSDAEVLMPMFEVQAAGPGQLHVAMTSDTTATVTHKPAIKVLHLKTGIVGAYFDGLQIDYQFKQGRWLASGYQAEKDWRGEAGRL